MKETEKNHYTESFLYELEQTVVYTRIKGAQIFNDLNVGVTVDQFITLDAIYCNKDICQRDLSKLILKDRSNTGRILNILEERGFIDRLVETKNKRLVKKIYITEKGKKIIEENQEKLRMAFMQVFNDITDEELDSLHETLSKIKSNLSKITTIQI